MGMEEGRGRYDKYSNKEGDIKWTMDRRAKKGETLIRGIKTETGTDVKSKDVRIKMVHRKREN